MWLANHDVPMLCCRVVGLMANNVAGWSETYCKGFYLISLSTTYLDIGRYKCNGVRTIESHLIVRHHGGTGVSQSMAPPPLLMVPTYTLLYSTLHALLTTDGMTILI